MKIAFVHDRIINIGGAEEVFMDLISKRLINTNKNDEYKIFTVFSDKKFLEVNGKNIEIVSIISNEWILKKIDYRNLMPLFPILTYLLSKKIKKYNPNETIFSSFAIAKNIKIDSSTNINQNDELNTILYLHSPMQYIWEMYDENINKLKHIKKLAYWFSSKYLRLRDLSYKTFDHIYFNSYYTKNLAKKLYGMEGEVYYPKISEEIINTPVSLTTHNYYIYIGRLVRFSKEVDKIINLFNITGENLLIMGSGPDEEYLKSIAGPNIVFLGYVQGEEKIKILKQAKGLVNLTKESFGMITAESLSLGVPVLGYKGGATPELVQEHSGILVNTKNEKDLLDAFKKFQEKTFNKELIKKKFLEKYLINTK